MTYGLRAASRSESPRAHDPSASVAVLIRALLAVGVVVVMVGGALALIRDGRLPIGSIPPALLTEGLARFEPAALAMLGILLLLATPPIALTWIGVSFAREGDRRFAGIVAGLLGLIVVGLLAALLAGAGEGSESLPPPSGLMQLGVLVAAAASGALGVQVGLGGAAFLVPILSGFFGVPMKLAIGAGAVSVVVNSLAGASSYLRDRIPNIRLGLILELPTLVGAVAGGLIVVAVAPSVLRGVFAVVLLGLAIRVVTRPGGGEVVREGADPLGVAGAYHDRASGEDVTYVPQRLRLGAAAGLVGGVLSGMLGLAGGVIKTPVMHSIMRMPVKAAAATSVLMGGFTVSASAYMYYVHGIIDLSIAIPAVLGIQIGSRTGARMSRHVSGTVLERVLAVVLTGLGVVLVLQLFGVGPGPTGS
ncbi:MAG: sulfite exporter TauE/SafE family protein [Gemmatimonadetes bacterium]|nr:sulfite exporter TauE/SafE family protein [Gemmatimonadota bacterium]